MGKHSLSRREVLRGGRDVGGLLALSALFQSGPGAASLEAAQAALRAAPDVYKSIGVRPLINGRGTFTILSGSLMLPEVRADRQPGVRGRHRRAFRRGHQGAYQTRAG